uniref:Uncharacterized protein n=1 Tax=Chrysotila carterae TaxID=13221 RepID=A0A7S4B6K0_CHRCT
MVCSNALFHGPALPSLQLDHTPQFAHVTSSAGYSSMRTSAIACQPHRLQTAVQGSRTELLMLCRSKTSLEAGLPHADGFPPKPRNWRERVRQQVRGLVSIAFDAATAPFIAILFGRIRRHQHRLRPKRIILVRHGLSEGNVDRSSYEHQPDSQIRLTERGFSQGKAAGQQIRKLIGDESVRFFFSPYLRTTQTLLAILEAFHGRDILVTSEPRLREQDFGNFQDATSMEEVFQERQRFGRFYYRFPNGEAGTDVYDRVADFWSTLYAFMERPRSPSETIENYVLVTHGLLMRIFCMCYFRWTVKEFEQVWNPSNCEIWVLEKDGANGFRHMGRWRASPFGGSLMPIAFGKNKREPVHEHMRRVRHRQPRV